MASIVNVLTDPLRDGVDYDLALGKARLDGFADSGVIDFIVKRKGMKSGRSCVMITFKARVGDGPLVQAQTVVSLSALVAALEILKPISESEG